MTNQETSDNFSAQNRFWVRGPNTSNHEINIWKFPTLEAAQNFAKTIAAEFPASYEIAEFIGIYRQTIPKPRPIEFVGEKSSK